MPLSETQTKILTGALLHPDGLAAPPSIPAGARQKVAQALLNAGLVEQVQRASPDARDLWAVNGETLLLALTATGRIAVSGAAVDGAQAAQAADTGHAGQRGHVDAHALPKPQRAGLREAAAALLAAWDAPDRPAIDDAIAALRSVFAGKPPRDLNVPRKPREGTKQETVLDLLRRVEGATIAQVIEATGWQQHTVRGFLAGLKKRHGIEVLVLDRVRQAGPNKTGAKGSYSIYQIKAAV